MNEGGWLGVASILLTSLFAYLNKRDQNKHDVELVIVKTELRENKAETEKCHQERNESKLELERVRRDLAARDIRDKEELQRQIDTLKKQVAEKKDRTDPHNPII